MQIIRPNTIDKNTIRLEENLAADIIINNGFGELIEASSIDKCKSFVRLNFETESSHQFVEMLHTAFVNHKAIRISPDQVWLLVCQSVSQHILFHSRKLRAKFVNHLGKMRIVIEKPDFVKGEDNAWPEVFTEFSAEVKKNIKTSLYEQMILNFSTTTAVEKNAFEVCFLKTMSHYFDFDLFTLCGIPEIQLAGKPEDYEKMIASLKTLDCPGLEWWTEKIIPVLEKFQQALRGEKDDSFWNSIYKWESHSGGDTVCGWITLFFAYIKETIVLFGWKRFLPYKKAGQQVLSREKMKKCERVEVLKKNPCNAQTTYYDSSFPDGKCNLPFSWKYFDVRYNMQLMSGFLGICEDETNTLEAQINWVVLRRT